MQARRNPSPYSAIATLLLILWPLAALAKDSHTKSHSKSDTSTPTTPKMPRAQATIAAAGSLVVPLFIQDRNFTGTLVMVNTADVPTFADVVLRDLSGREIARRRVPFLPHSQQRLEIAEVLLAAGSRATAGSLIVTQSPDLKGMSILAQMTMTYLGSREPSYLDEEVAMPSPDGSQVLRGVADGSENSPLVAITSLADSAQSVTVECLRPTGAKFRKSVQLLAAETLILEVCADRIVHGGDLDTVLGGIDEHKAHEAQSVGVAVVSDAAPGSFAAFGLLPHGSAHDRFFSAFAFDDPEMIMSSTKIFTGVPVDSATLLPQGRFVPHISFANFSSKPVRATIKYAQMIGNSPSARDVVQMIIPAGATKELALDILEGDPDLRNSFIISSDASPGELSVKLVATSDSRLREVELEAKDAKDPDNGGSHPWSLENGTESTLLLFNHSAAAQDFSVAIAANTTVWKKIFHLAPMQTTAIGIRDLIQSHVKDDLGTTLPVNSLGGQVLWFTAQGVGKGRVVQSNREIAMARNFSCGAPIVLCGAGFSAGTTTLIVGSQNVGFGRAVLSFCTQARGQQCSGSQTDTLGTGITYSWSSSDPNVITISGPNTSPTVSVNGVAGGSASVTADIEQASRGCSASAGKTGTVQVPTSLSLSLGSKVVYNGNHMIECDGTDDGPRFGYSRCGTFTLKDQNGNSITSGNFKATESVPTISSNPPGLNANTGGGSLANGTFQDFWAFVGTTAPPSPGQFVKARQSITIQDVGNSLTYRNIRINCLDFESSDVTVTDITVNGSCQ